MKRARFARDRLSHAAFQLQSLACCLAASGSRLEDEWLEKRLVEHIDRLLDNGNEKDLVAALQRLTDNGNQVAHDELAALIEGRAEAGTIQHADKVYDLLLFAAPLLAWSRYSIPAQRVPASTLDALCQALSETVFGSNARLVLADFLFSPDQLPRTYCATRKLGMELAAVTFDDSAYTIDSKSMPKTSRFLSDVRYLLGVLVLPRGDAMTAPPFRWNEAGKKRQTVLAQWTQVSQPLLEPRMVGCDFSSLLPNAFHTACREVDRVAPPYSLAAAIEYLHVTLNTSIDNLCVTIAPCYDKCLEEYRVSLAVRSYGRTEVHYGLVWPILGDDEDDSAVLQDIEALLHDLGVNDVESIDHRFPVEICEDCGVPLFANREGEMVHARMPEGTDESAAATLH